MRYHHCPTCGGPTRRAAPQAAARACPDCSPATSVDVAPEAAAGGGVVRRPPPDLRALTVRRAFERQATDTPTRRSLERGISRLLQDVDALEAQTKTCAPDEREALEAEQEAVAGRLTETIAALRALPRAYGRVD